MDEITKRGHGSIYLPAVDMDRVDALQEKLKTENRTAVIRLAITVLEYATLAMGQAAAKKGVAMAEEQGT